MDDSPNRPSDQTLEKRLADLRDLSDFCQHWPALKDALTEEDIERLETDPARKKLIKWLVLLADRICPKELY